MRVPRVFLISSSAAVPLGGPRRAQRAARSAPFRARGFFPKVWGPGWAFASAHRGRTDHPPIQRAPPQEASTLI
jgi:hypothetical protein